MLDATVQSAFVVILAWLFTLGAGYVNLPFSPATITSVAAVIVAYIVSKVAGPATISKVRGLISKK